MIWWNKFPHNGNGKLPSSQEEPRDADHDERRPECSPPSLRTLHYPATTLGRILDQTADRFPDAPALRYGALCWTYRELLAQVNRIAGGLAVLGVHRGDRVLMTLPNCPEFVVAFLAAQKLGAVVVNAGPLMGIDDLHKLMDMTQPRVVVALDLQAPQLDKSHPSHNGACWLWVSLKDYQAVWRRMGYRLKQWQARQHLADRSCQMTWQHMLEHAPPRPPTVAPEPDDVAVLQPTGGTTGTLKVAQLSHRNLLSNVLQLTVWAAPRPGQERVLAVLPMFHVYGLTSGLLLTLFNGGTLLPMTRFYVDQLLDLLREERPTIIGLVPAIIEAICDALPQLRRAEREAVCRVLREGMIISGAAPLSAAIVQHFDERVGAPIVQGYGLTEASPVTHVNLPDHPRAASIGLALPDTLTRVVDPADSTREVPPGEPGELLVSGPQIFSGYYQNPEETQHVLSVDDEGRTWLHTGDVVRVDAEGYFYVLDRKKHMINHAGLKVYPAKVESVLSLHPKVKDAAVVGRADPKHTEKVVAMVVCEDVESESDQTTVTSELRALCREHLARYEVPEEFEFIDRLPRSALGKLMKHELREVEPAGATSGCGGPPGVMRHHGSEKTEDRGSADFRGSAPATQPDGPAETSQPHVDEAASQPQAEPAGLTQPVKERT